MAITIEQTRCKVDCCKNPFRCVTGYTCPHHKADYEAARRRANQAKKRHTSERGSA